MAFKQTMAWLLKAPRLKDAILPVGVWWMEGVVAHITYQHVFRSDPAKAGFAWAIAGCLTFAVLRSLEFPLRQAFLVVAGSLLATSVSHPEFRFILPPYLQIPLLVAGFIIAVPLFYRGMERARS